MKTAGAAALLGALTLLPGSSRREAFSGQELSISPEAKDPTTAAIALEHAWRSRVFPEDKWLPLTKELRATVAELARQNPELLPASRADAARAELFRRLMQESEYHLKRSGWLVPIVSDFFRDQDHVREPAANIFSGAYVDYRNMLADEKFMQRFKELSGKTGLEWTPVCNDRAVLFLTAAVLRQRAELKDDEKKSFSIMLGVYLHPQHPERSEYHAWFQAENRICDPSVDAQKLTEEDAGSFRYVPLVSCDVTIQLKRDGGFTATHRSRLCMLPDELK